MSNLVLNFDEKNIIIDNANKYCCKQGVLINFELENGVLGQLYNCNITNVGAGSVLLKPSSFKFNYNKRVERFAVFAELSESRINLIKVSIVNEADPTDSVEDIVYIECGSLQKITVDLPEEQLKIKCGTDTRNSLIAMVKNLTIGETYDYEFKEYSAQTYEKLSNQSIVNVYNSNGNKFTFNNAIRYDINKRYVVSNGTYTLTGIPESHPIAVLNDGIAEISYVGDADKRIGEKEVDGSVYDFYYGDVTLNVVGDYGSVSIYCIYHGYMGGKDLFVYQEPANNLVFSPSSGTIVANRTEQNINSIISYSGENQSSIMTVSVKDNFNNFTYSANFTVECS